MEVSIEPSVIQTGEEGQQPNSGFLDGAYTSAQGQCLRGEQDGECTSTSRRKYQAQFHMQCIALQFDT